MAIERLPSTGDAPRSTGVPASLVPGGAADSAGFPWAGRTFDHHETAFADDDGSVPESYRQAITALREATLSKSAVRVAEAQADALVALSGIRVLVPLLAEAGGIGLTPEGRTVEKTQELSIVTVAAPDGRRVMPVFSSVDSMRVWNPEARPIPVPAPQAAIAAAQEQTDLIIIDPGSPDLEFGVRRTQLEAMALGRWEVPGWADSEVAEAFAQVTATEPRVARVELAPGDPDARLLTPEVDAVVTLQPGLDREQLSEIIETVQRTWAASPIIAARIDSMRLVLR
ncbi:MAG: SseB family protein [Microbacteriaceae bacterium]|nr:SseB family protein [Microbacteriaceae bacterium]